MYPSPAFFYVKFAPQRTKLEVIIAGPEADGSEELVFVNNWF
jgi:hypothetical protein